MTSICRLTWHFPSQISDLTPAGWHRIPVLQEYRLSLRCCVSFRAELSLFHFDPSSHLWINYQRQQRHQKRKKSGFTPEVAQLALPPLDFIFIPIISRDDNAVATYHGMRARPPSTSRISMRQRISRYLSPFLSFVSLGLATAHEVFLFHSLLFTTNSVDGDTLLAGGSAVVCVCTACG